MQFHISKEIYIEKTFVNYISKNIIKNKYIYKIITHIFNIFAN